MINIPSVVEPAKTNPPVEEKPKEPIKLSESLQDSFGDENYDEDDELMAALRLSLGDADPVPETVSEPAKVESTPNEPVVEKKESKEEDEQGDDDTSVQGHISRDVCIISLILPSFFFRR